MTDENRKLGEFRGIEYIYMKGPIGNPVAYIRIPDDHPWNKMVDITREIENYKGKKVTYHTGYDEIPLDVHGGLTFARRITEGDEWPQGFTPGAWVGWDYSHAGDWMPYHSADSGRKWDMEEVEMECKRAIIQLLGEENDRREQAAR